MHKNAERLQDNPHIKPERPGAHIFKIGVEPIGQVFPDHGWLASALVV